jgi:hypothetical protein
MKTAPDTAKFNSALCLICDAAEKSKAAGAHRAALPSSPYVPVTDGNVGCRTDNTGAVPLGPNWSGTKRVRLINYYQISFLVSGGTSRADVQTMFRSKRRVATLRRLVELF